MKAVEIIRQGIKNSAVSLTSIKKPFPTGNELLVKNTYAGVNFIDTYHRSGLYKKDTPFVLGVEGVGVIEELGPKVTGNFVHNDRVAYFVDISGFL